MRQRIPPLPAAPTTALPGTPEKVAVLIQRARLKQALWHPRDATFGNAERTRGSYSRFTHRAVLSVG